MQVEQHRQAVSTGHFKGPVDVVQRDAQVGRGECLVRVVDEVPVAHRQPHTVEAETVHLREVRFTQPLREILLNALFRSSATAIDHPEEDGMKRHETA